MLAVGLSVEQRQLIAQTVAPQDPESALLGAETYIRNTAALAEEKQRLSEAVKRVGEQIKYPAISSTPDDTGRTRAVLRNHRQNKELAAYQLRKAVEELRSAGIQLSPEQITARKEPKGLKIETPDAPKAAETPNSVNTSRLGEAKNRVIGFLGRFGVVKDAAGQVAQTVAKATSELTKGVQMAVVGENARIARDTLHNGLQKGQIFFEPFNEDVQQDRQILKSKEKQAGKWIRAGEKRAAEFIQQKISAVAAPAAGFLDQRVVKPTTERVAKTKEQMIQVAGSTLAKTKLSLAKAKSIEVQPADIKAAGLAGFRRTREVIAPAVEPVKRQAE